MAKIKICGLKTLEDILIINEAGVDYAGFIFAPQSKRCISKELAKQMKKSLNPSVKSVGVFVNEKIEVIKELAWDKVIDLIQLHGNETEQYISQISKETNLPVIKAFKADYNLEANIKNTCADYVLIDSFELRPCGEEGAAEAKVMGAGSRTRLEQFGGTGKTFDYNLIPNTKKPLFIAGGLNIQNIDNALKLNPYCLDINSGVETDGKKDKEKIFAIVQKIRSNKFSR